LGDFNAQLLKQHDLKPLIPWGLHDKFLHLELKTPPHRPKSANRHFQRQLKKYQKLQKPITKTAASTKFNFYSATLC